MRTLNSELEKPKTNDNSKKQQQQQQQPLLDDGNVDTRLWNIIFEWKTVDSFFDFDWVENKNNKPARRALLALLGVRCVKAKPIWRFNDPVSSHSDSQTVKQSGYLTIGGSSLH